MANGALTKHFETGGLRVPVIRASILSILVSNLAGRGLDTAALLREYDVPGGLLTQRYAVVELWRYVALFEAAARVSGNELLGFELGQSCRPEQIGPLGILFVLLPTLRDALSAFSELLLAVQSETSLLLVTNGGQAEFSYRINAVSIWPRRQDTEFTFALLLTLFRARLGARWVPQQVEFEHAASQSAATLRRGFGCPVLYERPLSRIVFGAADLDISLPNVNTALIDVVRQHVLDLIGEAGEKRGLVDDALAATVACMSEETACLACVARRLGMTTRTLQRDLLKQGWTFRRLLDRCRRDMVQTLQARGEASRDAVAQRLGYSDGTALSRARQRWRKQV